MIAWAGWNPLQQAQAVAGFLLDMRMHEGWTTARLIPLLAGLLELLPWLKQWHNALDPEYGTGMGDYFAGFLDGQLRELELTRAAVTQWQPAPTVRQRGGKRKT